MEAPTGIGTQPTLASQKPTYTQAICFRTSQALHEEGSRLDITSLETIPFVGLASTIIL
jgi:hypothetical protein